MAFRYSPGDFRADFYHHDPYPYQYLNQGYGNQPTLSLGQSITKVSEHQLQAQNLQGLIQVIALIAVSLFTSYINEKNNKGFQEPVVKNNTSSNSTPAPAPMPVTVNPLISILFKVPEAGAGITFHLTQSQMHPLTTGQTNDQGEFRTSVLPNVPIEVAISGTIDGDKIINVTQTIPPSPGVFQFVIPTVKEIDLNEGEFMAVLTWPSAVLDLDLAALGIAYGSCHCLHFFGGDEGPCDMGGKVVLQQDNILNSGIESLRFGYRYAVARSNNSLAGRNSRERYDIFVHNPEEVPSIARSGAIITVFYGKTSKTVNVPTSDPNSNSLFWFAGSFNVDTGVFEETPVSESFVDLRTQGDCTELIQKNYGGI